MAAVTLSNPLHLAVLGNPKRKKTRGSSKRRRRSRVRHKSKTKDKTKKGNPMARRRRSRKSRKSSSRRKNPSHYKRKSPSKSTRRRSRRRSTGRRKSYRRNPTIAKTSKQFVGGLTGTPAKVMNLFKGKNKVRNIAYTAGGGIATYMIGGIVAKAITPITARIPGMTNPMVQRITGALFPYAIGFFGSRLVKDQNIKTALQVGGGLASIIELLMPGQVGRIIGRIPGIRNLQAGAAGAGVAKVAAEAEQGPVATQQEGIGQMMLAGYVDAPAYAGTAGYVDAPAYAGTAGLGQEMLAEYVDAPAYAGTAGLGQEMLAGNYLEESNMFQPMF